MWRHRSRLSGRSLLPSTLSSSTSNQSKTDPSVTKSQISVDVRRLLQTQSFRTMMLQVLRTYWNNSESRKTNKKTRFLPSTFRKTRCLLLRNANWFLSSSKIREPTISLIWIYRFGTPWTTLIISWLQARKSTKEWGNSFWPSFVIILWALKIVHTKNIATFKSEACSTTFFSRYH